MLVYMTSVNALDEPTGYLEGYIQANDYRIHYLEWGKEGPDIILIHGSAPFCSAHDLETIGNALGDMHHIIAFDLIGHTLSDDPRELLGFEKHVSILHEAARLKDFHDTTLVGWSYGGWLSMVWANLYPDEVEKLVLIEVMPVTYTRPTPQDPENTPEIFRSEEEAVEFYMRSFTPLTDRPPRRYAEESVRLSRKESDGRVIPLSHHSRRLKLRKDIDLWSVYSRIRAPMLLVWGRDSFIPAEAVERMKAINSNLTVVEVKGANHFVPMSHTRETIGAVKQFLKIE